MTEHENSPATDDLPAPIQLTPDQLTEVSGGSGCGGVVIIIRKGLPAVAI